MNNKGENAHFQALQQAFDAFWPGPMGDAITLKRGHLEVTVYPQDAARMTSLRVFGYELLRQWNPQRRAFQYGSFPMVPWVGRLGNGQLDVNGKIWQLPANKPPHALHGMACYSLWEVVEQTHESLTLRMTLAAPWPWKGYVIQRITLQDDALIMHLEIHSEIDTFPASAGWHPWFLKHLYSDGNQSELSVQFSADWQEETGENELPTGKRITPQPGPWDDCFGFIRGIHASLVWPDRLTLNITSTAHSLVIFDKQPDATCVNPQTQAPNDINRIPQYVTQNQPLIISSEWKFTKYIN